LLNEKPRRLRLRHQGLRTEQADVAWERRFFRANGRRHPRGMGAVEVEGFLSALANEGQMAAGTQDCKQGSACSARSAELGA
jgi:hypothetical protein